MMPSLKKYKKSLMIFRRDLRLHDNTALYAALEQSEEVIPCFIIDPRQIDEASNPYKSMNSLQFMIASLHDLHEQLAAYKGKLYLFHGVAEEVIERLIKKKLINAIFFNMDYTPFSLKRDAAISHVAGAHSIPVYTHHQAVLNEPNSVKTGNNDPFSIFTAYYNKASKISVSEPYSIPHGLYARNALEEMSLKKLDQLIKKRNNDMPVTGGRAEALAIADQLEDFKDYASLRDIPSHSTTYLSAHNKFGTLSIRELYYAIAQKLGHDHLLIKQLYWRDFFTQLAYHSPFVYGAPFKEKYANIPWNTNQEDFERWCTGTTGFPIVDAGMRELNATGFMHNRVRMIVGSFLVKDLHINWLWGERYFAQKLVDYDPAVNNGNWQWVASTGADAQPYFRIFNPWLQQKKFDPNCIYIKTWIPELSAVENKIIHNLHTNKDTIVGYPKPMVDHALQASMAKKLYY